MPLKLTSHQLRQKYLDFFQSSPRNHAIIPSAPLVPENDPTVLFTTAGMHPLVPYLLGQPHPEGKRLADVQKCLRTDDIDEVGDYSHHTFFEMLGNWSLGDYFKKEAIQWSYEFLINKLQLDPDRLYPTCFAGDNDAPKDEEAAKIWQSVGIPKERIYFFDKKENWWGPAGATGPCGPDSEMHYDMTGQPCKRGSNCRPNCDCDRFYEIWNDVFMQYNKTSEGKFEKLPAPNVDTGMGFERMLAVINDHHDNFLTDLWQPAIKKISDLSGKDYQEHHKPFRILADHLRAALFIIADGVVPANKERGYILRRLIRRATVYAQKLDIKNDDWISQISSSLISPLADVYSEVSQPLPSIVDQVTQEITKFEKSLRSGTKQLTTFIKKHPLDEERQAENLIRQNIKPFDVKYEEFVSNFPEPVSLPSVAAGTAVFDAQGTHGLPPEYSIDIIKQENWIKGNVDVGQAVLSADLLSDYHQELSRTASVGMFKGGLADHSEQVTRCHTATHLLLAALRQVLDHEVLQRGSNITTERLRLDFPHDAKLTDEQLKAVQDLVNQKIKEDLPVTSRVTTHEQAVKQGAQATFGERYPEKVTVYTIGDLKGDFFSKELCAGPHVKSTGEIGEIEVFKEKSVSSGIRRIYARQK
jgi:alanyl-tRNA synthetase